MNQDTSYSDPFYDKLEGFFHTLGKYWYFVLLGFVVVIVIGLSLRSAEQSSPLAASAQALEDATIEQPSYYPMVPQYDEEKLKAILTNESVVAEYKARACNALVQMALDTGNTAGAIDYAKQGIDFLTEDAPEDLTLTLQLSAAAAQRQAGNIAEARALTQTVLQNAGSLFAAHTLKAHYALAELDLEELAQLSDEEQEAQKATLQESALNHLSMIKDSPEPSAKGIANLAAFRYNHIIRDQAGLNHVTPVATPETAETAAPTESAAQE